MPGWTLQMVADRLNRETKMRPPRARMWTAALVWHLLCRHEANLARLREWRQRHDEMLARTERLERLAEDEERRKGEIAL